MKKLILLLFSGILLVGCNLNSDTNSRQTILLDSDWKFMNEEVEGGENPETSTANWEVVSVPHDWAISGEFV